MRRKPLLPLTSRLTIKMTPTLFRVVDSISSSPLTYTMTNMPPSPAVAPHMKWKNNNSIKTRWRQEDSRCITLIMNLPIRKKSHSQ